MRGRWSFQTCGCFASRASAVSDAAATPFFMLLPRCRPTRPHPHHTPPTRRRTHSLRSSGENFAAFTALNTLVLDNNALRLETLQSFPPLASVGTLWLNNNELDDLAGTVEAIVGTFPGVTFLSMMENPLNPGPFVMGQEKNYERYRLYTIYHLPGLKMLDATPVTAAELVKAQKTGHMQISRKPTAAPRAAAAPPADAAAQAAEALRTRQIDPRTRKLRKPTALLGIRENHYDGRQSEGNRFITDDNL